VDDTVAGEHDFIETMRCLAIDTTWTIAKKGDRWAILWANGQGEILATGEGATFAEAWDAVSPGLDAS
jgi:hypothetical protein